MKGIKRNVIDKDRRKKRQRKSKSKKGRTYEVEIEIEKYMTFNNGYNEEEARRRIGRSVRAGEGEIKKREIGAF